MLDGLVLIAHHPSPVLLAGLRLSGLAMVESENAHTDSEGMCVPDCVICELPSTVTDLGALKALKEKNSQVGAGRT